MRPLFAKWAVATTVRWQAGYQVRSERDEPAASRNGVDEHRQKHKRAHDEQRYGVHGFLTVSLLLQWR